MHRVFGKECAGPLNHAITPLRGVFYLFNFLVKVKCQYMGLLYAT